MASVNASFETPSWSWLTAGVLCPLAAGFLLGGFFHFPRTGATWVVRAGAGGFGCSSALDATVLDRVALAVLLCFRFAGILIKNECKEIL